jgi:hypothetical protein
MNSYINLILDAEGAKARLRRLLQSAPEPEIAREDVSWKPWSNVQLLHGLKMGLSGVLALYLAELLRLQFPAWSLFAVIVLMTPSLCRFDRFEISHADDRYLSRWGTWCMAG